MEILWVLAKWMGWSSIALAGAWFEFKFNRKKMDRIFDTFTQDVKIDILESYVAYAKKDIAENNYDPMTENMISIACLYGAYFFINPTDFQAMDLTPIVAWHGSKPPRPPKP